MKVSFQTQHCCFLVELNNGETAREIVRNFPLDAKVSTWGDEIYFETDINAACDEEKITIDVTIGDVAYWPAGRCVCVFFGPTPISVAGNPVPASPVVVIGRAMANPVDLRKIRSGDAIRLTVVQEELPMASRVERKLTQIEIDALVKQLLSEKSVKENQGLPR